MVIYGELQCQCKVIGLFAKVIGFLMPKFASCMMITEIAFFSPGIHFDIVNCDICAHNTIRDI